MGANNGAQQGDIVGERDGKDGGESELDGEGFDAEVYVRGVLGREGLGGLLRIEGALIGGMFVSLSLGGVLVSEYGGNERGRGVWVKFLLMSIEWGIEIKGLDGERKALVYDNYSKLITATDTIRKVRGLKFPQRPLTEEFTVRVIEWLTRYISGQMRTNMDPLTPTTSTLSPTISHIAETASSLATSLRERSSRATHPDKADTEKRMKPQQETVRWVLAMPGRLRRLLEGGKREEAVRDWEAVEGLLGKWEERGVGGAREVREECEGILERGVGRLAVGVDV